MHWTCVRMIGEGRVLVHLSRTEACDVLVIGAGAAGIRAALEPAAAGLRTLMVTKGRFGYSGATFYAKTPGWGMQAVVGETEGDSPEEHVAEIREAGQGMEDPGLARILAEEAPARFRDLLSYGVPFLAREGQPLKMVGCFSRRPRAMAAIGMDSIRSALVGRVVGSGCHVREGYHVFALVKHSGRCVGALAWTRDGVVGIRARAVVLASGGATQVYPLGLSGGEATGDGYVLGLNAGATLANMEFIQILFAITRPIPKVLLSERVFTHLPRMLNAGGREFLSDYLPQGTKVEEVLRVRSTHGPFSAGLPSRWVDIAVASEMAAGRGFPSGGVLLQLPESLLRDDRWYSSSWVRWVTSLGVDLRQGLVVAPFAQAFNGGLVIGPDAGTGVPGLYAAGEVAAGPHGADRLGGNMIAATQVFGFRAGHSALECALGTEELAEDVFRRAAAEALAAYPFREVITDGGLAPHEVIRTVRQLMHKAAYVVREGVTLAKAVDAVTELLHGYDPKHWLALGSSSVALAANSLAEVGRAVLTACLVRRESRGSHYRSDFPRPDASLCTPLGLRKSAGGLEVFSDPFSRQSGSGSS